MRAFQEVARGGWHVGIVDEPCVRNTADELIELIDDELDAVDAMLARGVARERVYDELRRQGYECRVVVV